MQTNFRAKVVRNRNRISIMGSEFENDLAENAENLLGVDLCCPSTWSLGETLGAFL